MDETTIIGYAVTAVITLGGFIAVILRFMQPINDLRVVIQKLNDNIDIMKRDSEKQATQINRHGERIDKLDHRVGNLETKMEFYHNE